MPSFIERLRRTLALGVALLIPYLPTNAAEETIPPAKGNIFDCDISPQENSNFSLAQFRIWLPAQKAPVRGVLVVLPGSNANGLPLANDSIWQSVATKWNYALMGVTLTTANSPHPYYHAESGSGDALLTALQTLATASAHPEIAAVPIAILGHSQGGQFAYHFACWSPSRVLAFAAIKGGYYDMPPNDVSKAVPGLLITAAEDAEYRQKNIRRLFDENPTPRSRWAFASEPNSKHEIGRSLQLILPFFDALITNAVQPWVGHLETHTITPWHLASEPGQSWLPNENVGKVWSQFQRGTLQDPPPALTIPSAPVPKVANVFPVAHDFGSVTETKDPPTATFHVLPLSNGEAWTDIRAQASKSWCEISVNQSDGQWSLLARPIAARMPFGRLTTTIDIRYLLKGTPIPGGTQLNVALNHISADFELSAASFYLGVYSAPCSRRITLKSKAGKPLQVVSAAVSDGTSTRVTHIRETEYNTVIAAEFFPLSEEGNNTGIITVKLDLPSPATILIPFIGYYRPPFKTESVDAPSAPAPALNSRP